MTAGAAAAPASAWDDSARQELRLAAVFTGGVSLAIWMGGVARELNLLLGQGKPEGEWAPQVARCYQALLDVVGVNVRLDVMSGTSAGGINAAVLALANVKNADIGSLRQLWMQQGALSELLRDAGDHPTPSLLQGDRRLLQGLRSGLGQIASSAERRAGRPGNDDDRETDVFITTTFLNGEPSRFVDAYGTLVSDVDHHGLFHFDNDRLQDASAVAQLALAARCSASFPVAFEPGFVPIGNGSDTDCPDMADVSNATRSRWVADGGLLANRPIAAAVRAVFDRKAQSDVRRVLLYVVPTARSTVPPQEASGLPPLGDTVVKDLAAMTSQAITADLAGIRAHNESVGVRLDTYQSVAALGLRLTGDLVTDDMYGQYVRRVSDSVAGVLVDEALCQIPAENLDLLGSDGAEADSSGLPLGSRVQSLRERVAARIAADLPGKAPIIPGDFESLGRLGQRGYDGAKTIALDLVSRAYQRHPRAEQRQHLAEVRRLIHAAMPRPPAGALDIVGMVQGALARPPAGLPEAAALAEVWASRQQQPGEFADGWQQVAGAIAGERELLRSLLETTADSDEVMPDPVLAYLGEDPADIASRLGQLHIAQSALLPDTRVADQRLELIQVSADTATLLDTERIWADQKLTGLQLHHFGAFYKYSWRANDWMWGRLDGAGWLVHVLLDPRRLAALRELDDHPDSYADRLIDRLQRIAAGNGDPVAKADTAAVPPKAMAELAFLRGSGRRQPASLPETAKWVAAGLQRLILADELPCIAEQISQDERAKAYVNADAKKFVAMQDPAADVTDLLKACRVSDEKFAQERNSKLFRRTFKRSARLTVAAIMDSGKVPGLFKPALRLLGFELAVIPAGVQLRGADVASRLFRTLRGGNGKAPDPAPPSAD